MDPDGRLISSMTATISPLKRLICRTSDTDTQIMKSYTTHLSRLSIIALSMILLVGLPASSQRSSTRTRINTSKLLETKNIDVVYISPAMLQSVPKASLKIDGADAMSGIMDGITSIHIYTSSDRKAIQELRRTFAPVIELRHSDLEQLMYVKDDNGVVNLIGQLQGDNATELYMIVSGDDEYTVINFSGSFSRRELEKAVTQDNRKRKK